MHGEPDLSKRLKLKFRLYSLRSKRFIYTGIVQGHASAYGTQKDNGKNITFNIHELSGVYKKSVKRGLSAMLEHCGL
ncbi:MAG: hypothetical protein MUF68_07000 [Cyclobacteriaceae bacterium]|nr:hypothetical protein [Cyclobacteriaceae bacterium]